MRNLRRAPARPALGNGRIQKALRRCFLALGPVVPADVLYSWARRWPRSLDGQRINQRERHSIVRVLVVMAERVGRASTPGRPWLWRLSNSVDNTSTG
jgi:hypothetical protein